MGENLTIAWWNTSMSPASRRDRMDEDQRKIALLIIVKLIDKYKLDILCLGEVSPNDIGLLEKILESQPYAIYNCTHTNGRIKHDLCIIYNKQKMCHIESIEITNSIPHMGFIRAGHKLHFYHSNSEQNLFIYVLHWPSHMHFGDPSKRYELGRALHQSIEDCKKEQN
ncbi:hypothetical protein [Arsenophonus endosymbiont of Crataerina pallida]|uniref:hypothetical protein n=2 Tax=unclassified Arsenophonus TaxID=2627083 RepID=UPI0030D2903A